MVPNHQPDMVTTPFNYVVPMDLHPLINHIYIYIVFTSMYPMYHWIFKALVIYLPPGIHLGSPNAFQASMRRVVPATPAVMAGTLMAVQLGWLVRSSGEV